MPNQPINNNQNVNNDLATAIGNLAREIHGMRNNNGGNNVNRVTDYARSYRQQANIAIPNTTIGANGGIWGQFSGDFVRNFDRMTIGLLPTMRRNFLDPLRHVWGDGTNRQSFIGRLASSAATIFVGALGVINDALGNIYSYFRNILTQSYNQFMDIQRIVGGISADIGLTRAESKGLLLNFTELAVTAMEFGGSIADIGTMISSFSDTTGKNRLFDANDVKNIEKIGLGTKLGVEGMSQLVGQFNNLGISMKKTFDVVNKAKEGAAKLGINVDKVLRTYTGLVNGLTGFQMKSGLDNMVKLATQATQLRMDLSGVAETMSSAFFEPEAAVEAAAKMQVLGGQFAEKFGDAFELMYKAQVSPEMFQKDLMNMVKGMAIKGENGLFYVPPQKMRMLQEAGKTLGVNAKELINGAIEQGKLTDKISALSNQGIIFKNDEERQAIANLIDFDSESGSYMIRMMNGKKRLLKETSESDLRNILREKKADDDAAKKRLNFSERLSNVFARFQMSFTQVFAQIFDKLDDSGFMNKVDDFMTTIANKIIPTIKNLFSDEGKINQLLEGIFKKATSLIEGLTNIWNGKAGFWDKIKDSVAGLVKGVWGIVEPYLAIGFGKLLMAIGKATGSDTITSWGQTLMLDVAKENKNNEYIQKLTGTPEEKKQWAAAQQANRTDLSAKQVLTAGGLGIIGGLGGGLGGAAYGATIGSVVPGVGTAIGGILGAIAGSLLLGGGTALAEKGYNVLTTPTDDALMTPGGRVFRGGKGDIGVLFDQAGLANKNNNSGVSEIKHSGEITVKSEDGKQITISDLDKIGRYTLAQYMDSINHGLKNGTAVYNNEKMPITPISV